jgi:hypothetical protein
MLREDKVMEVFYTKMKKLLKNRLERHGYVYIFIGIIMREENVEIAI